MENSKKTIGLMVVGVLTFIGLVVGATYAYFVAQGGDTSTSGVNITSTTTDSFVLGAGGGISLDINQTNFSDTEGSKSGNTTATATLIANSETNEAARNYYLYLDITENGIKYTTDAKSPELILNVTDKDNNEVTLNGLEKVNVTDRTNTVISGYDITDIRGLITLVNNKEIKVEAGTINNKVVDTWKVTVTMVNLDADQSANAGKSFAAQLKMQKDKTDRTLASACQGNNMAGCLANNSYLENTIIYHDGVGEEVNANLEAGDNSYRYTGANPNNFVCFGDDCTNSDNLYRIVGVFDNKVKLIKADFANTNLLGTEASSGTTHNKSDFPNYKGNKTTVDRYYWSGASDNGSNTWSESTLKTMALNTTFLDNLGTTWASKIAEATWKVGGNTWDNLANQNAKIAFDAEITTSALNGADGKTEDAFKIGLIYVSDYYYAANSEYWSYKGYGGTDGEATDYRSAINDNWMYMGIGEWSLSRVSNYTYSAVSLSFPGSVGDALVYHYQHGVRPVFYLKSSVKLIGGEGTQDQPYRII